MRLLALAPTGFFADYGCHVRIMGQLLALQQVGVVVRLVTYPAGRDINGLQAVRPPSPFSRNMPVGSSRRKLLLDAMLAPTALIEAIRFRPHIIHAYLHEGALMGWWLARWMRTALTFDYQGSLTAEMIDHRFLAPSSPFLPRLVRLERWIDNQPHAVFPSSLQAAKQLESHVSSTRLYPLADSIDPHFFAPQPPDDDLRRRLGIDPNQPTVVYLGLLAPYQGTDLLLNAVATPPLRDRDVQFLIMGFPHVARYQAMANRLGISEKVRFTGAIPYQRAPRYLALGDLAVAPKISTTEGSGKVLTYMSMALPVVATDTPVHRQYLGTEGKLAAKPDPVTLATALSEALDDLSGLQKAAQVLRQRVQAQYTWQHAAERLLEVFRSLQQSD